MTDFTYYLCQDGTLARTTPEGWAPEVWFPNSKIWSPYPDLDTLHDARPLDPDEENEWGEAPFETEASDS